MYQIKFSIKTLSPLVITAASNATLMTESHDEINGSMIRGILATRYIQEKNLGYKAHEDKNFRELFFGNLKFLSATPAIDDKRSFILPQSLQRGKKGTVNAKNVQDLLSGEKPPAGYKSLRGYGIVDGDKIFRQNYFVERKPARHKFAGVGVEKFVGGWHKKKSRLRTNNLRGKF